LGLHAATENRRRNTNADINADINKCVEFLPLALFIWIQFSQFTDYSRHNIMNNRAKLIICPVITI
jgi:hypothetical protein